MHRLSKLNGIFDRLANDGYSIMGVDWPPYFSLGVTGGVVAVTIICLFALHYACSVLVVLLGVACLLLSFFVTASLRRSLGSLQRHVMFEDTIAGLLASSIAAKLVIGLSFWNTWPNCSIGQRSGSCGKNMSTTRRTSLTVR